MGTKQIHLSYIALILLLAITVTLSRILHGLPSHLSTYFFATAKSLVILFIFMKVKKTQGRSWLLFIISIAMLFILVFFSLDDVLFREGLNKLQ